MSPNPDILDALGLPPLPSTSPDTIAALLWTREVLQQHITTTYAVTDPNGIEELKAVKIGGVDQWLHIRGRNRNNPVLLIIHGGPGSPVIGHGTDAMFRPWEDYFTMVLWDQRQTGKSYYPADDENNPLTVAQFVDDTEQVVQYLRDSLDKDKLFILGVSWGTVLGMHIVKRHPDWLYAYIGVGQVASSIDAEKTLYARLLNRAKENNEHETVDKLEAIIPLLDADFPEREKTFVENSVFVRRALSGLAGETFMHHRSASNISRISKFEKLISPHLSLTDLSNAILGDDIALLRPPYTFTKEFLDNNLPKELGSSFEVPIFFFTGRHDWQTPVTLSDQWFSEIDAPHKALIHFEESSHFVINEEPGKFLITLVNKVLPLASEGTTRD